MTDNLPRIPLPDSAKPAPKPTYPLSHPSLPTEWTAYLKTDNLHRLLGRFSIALATSAVIAVVIILAQDMASVGGGYIVGIPPAVAPWLIMDGIALIVCAIAVFVLSYKITDSNKTLTRQDT
jgi:hypothetical protein